MKAEEKKLLAILVIALLLVIVSSNFINIGALSFINSIVKLILFFLIATFSISLLAMLFTKFNDKLYLKLFFFSTILLISFGMYIFCLSVKMK